MKLYIDTKDKDSFTVTLGTVVHYEKNQNAQAVLPALLAIFQKNSLTFQVITEIEVSKGPGSYTSLRVGFAVANTLGYLLSIPVNGSKPPTASLPAY